MAIVVVGGHSRSVGKTSVVVGLISALPEFDWTAAKLTQFGHGICSAHGEPCDCAPSDLDHAFAITEELDRSGSSDTSRFLLAGARKAWWVRTQQGRLAEAMPELRRRLASSRNIILESNSVLQFIRPDVYLSVLDPAIDDFKNSARLFLDRADGLIVHTSQGVPTWREVSLKPASGRPIFRITPPPYCTAAIVGFVRERLARNAVGPSL